MNHSLTHQIYPDSNLVYVVASGEIQFSSFYQMFKQLLMDKQYCINMNCLWDSSGIDSVDGDLDDLRAAVSLINDNNLFNINTRTAILIDRKKENIEKYTQGFILMASESNIEHRVFDNINDNQLLGYLNITELPW
jgi:hypothetical protein